MHCSFISFSRLYIVCSFHISNKPQVIVETIEQNLQQNLNKNNESELCLHCNIPWKNDDGDTMTFCENCQQWMHYHCAGVDKVAVQRVDEFVCIVCARELLMYKKKADEQKHLNEDKLTINKLKNENILLKDKYDKSMTLQRKMNSEHTQELTTLKSEMKSKDELIGKTNNSLEILTKKTASMEKELNQSNQKLSSLEDSLSENVNAKTLLEDKITLLENEIKSHVKINQDLISNNINDTSKSSGCESCKC